MAAFPLSTLVMVLFRWSACHCQKFLAEDQTWVSKRLVLYHSQCGHQRLTHTRRSSTLCCKEEDVVDGSVSVVHVVDGTVLLADLSLSEVSS